jgi:hypothetical protein
MPELVFLARLWHPRFIMQASDQDSGITYGALLALVVSVAMTLGVSGSVGYLAARATGDTARTNTTPPAQQTPVSIDRPAPSGPATNPGTDRSATPFTLR